MGAVIALEGLLAQRRVWRGQAVPAPAPAHPTGWTALDTALPSGGWPDAALSELLLPADGIGELRLLWPTLARLSQASDAVIVLVSPPCRPHPPAWQAAGIRLGALHLIETAHAREALWATEQCLRSGACSAVLGWPRQADDRALRRLQVAAETGQTLGFAFRPLKAAVNPSPAALRIAFDPAARQLRVLKCRGGLAPAHPIALPDLFLSATELRRHCLPSPAPPVEAPPRPRLHEVLQGGMRPITLPAAAGTTPGACAPDADAPDEDPAQRHAPLPLPPAAASLRPPLAFALPLPPAAAVARPAGVTPPSSASPGPAPLVPAHGIALAPVQA
ncbi:translesion DNA synthesis-associated protein ImuA [Lysobacter solisilvae]|uniref:Translesion DNA synthesis-associated protein ImuA n=1 Tax=Agrilutibacter solisilvae TaxID=2763317 RepID=A0A974XXM4_9GAMM|nr:translesion DNA synthesis-associated protein ImuA [Lysobacter solisilvae]